MSSKLFDVERVFERIPAILAYLPVTMQLVLYSTALSLIVGALVALIKINRVPVLRQIAAFYVSFARGTPSIVQLYLIFFGIPLALRAMNTYWGTNFNTVAPSMLCAIIAFTFNEGAYASENIRAALESVDRGQREAALSIGMTPVQAFFRIILLEALVVALPPLGNSFIGSIKNTSLAFTCAVVEMTAGAKLLASRDYRYFEMYVSLALIYWAITFLVSRALTWAEKKLRCDEREVSVRDSAR